MTANKVVAAGATAKSDDQMIANWLSIGNQSEIAISKIAESKAENKDVRKFAEMMVKDHTQLQQQLEKFGHWRAVSRAARARGSLDCTHRGRYAAASSAAGTNPTGAQGTVGADRHADIELLEIQARSRTDAWPRPKRK